MSLRLILGIGRNAWRYPSGCLLETQILNSERSSSVIFIRTLSFHLKTSCRKNCHSSRRVSPCILPISDKCKRTSRGSVTLEAALAVPMFFLAVLSLFYMMEVMSIRTSIRSGMQYAGKKYAREAYVKPVVSITSLEQDIVKAIGSDRLNRSIVEGGSSGIQCLNSRMSYATAVLELKVTYYVKLPIPIFHAPAVKMQEELKVKGWKGYVKNGFSGQDSETVYITETGMVYHRDYHCNYLELSIRMVPQEDVADLRNESQGKYYACEHCMGNDTPKALYITDYGDRYHSSLSCSGLKRTIYAVPLSEAAGKGACSKCGK